MKKVLHLAVLLLFSMSFAHAGECPEVLEFQAMKLRSSQSIDFCAEFKNKVVLAVNTASNCAYTPQFKELEALYQKFQSQGLVIVGFPSNDFNQEFDDAEKTAKVCYVNYGVTFPMLTKSSVKGPDANDFFQRLITATGHQPQWNFNKYLISRDGKTITAHPSHVTPKQLEADVQAMLNR